MGDTMKKILFILFVVISLFSGCDILEDNNMTEDKLESIFEYELNDNVRFYGDELSEHISLINDTTMLVVASMPSEHVPQIGDVILCPSTENTPRGFLRRVSSIDNGSGGLIVSTTLATLTDAFYTLQYEQTYDYAECAKEFRDSLGNLVPFKVHSGSIMNQLDSTNVQTKAKGDLDLGSKSLEFDISNRFFSGSAYIEAQIHVKFDVGFGKINEVTYEIDKKVGLKGKAFISSSGLGGTDYYDDFSLPILDKYIPVGTPIGPPLMQFFPSLSFGVAFVGNGNLSLEGKVNYVLEDTKSRYSYKKGVEQKEVINNIGSNKSWMKMVALEAKGEFGLQGSVGMELRLWNGDLLAFGGDASLWYGLKAETGISMSDKELLLSGPKLTVHPTLSAALYIESYFINNRKHRVEAKVEKSFESFDINSLPEFKQTTAKEGTKLIVKPIVEPISMIEVSQQGYALFSAEKPNEPITHKALPSSTIEEEVPTAPYVDIQLEPADVTFSLPADREEDEEYFVKPYVIADGKYYYGKGGDDRWVDLGLPSGILWAKYNVGACSPEEYGDYYAWGEIEVKNHYTFGNYTHCMWNSEYEYWQSIKIGKDISGTKYDAAHVKWGDGARMPTDDEIREIVYGECHLEEGTLNNVKGVYCIGPNGNSIFLPFAGIYNNSYFFSDPFSGVYVDGIQEEGTCGYFWSSSDDYEYLRRGGLHIESGDREFHLFSHQIGDCGVPIRPVKDK